MASAYSDEQTCTQTRYRTEQEAQVSSATRCRSSGESNPRSGRRRSETRERLMKVPLLLMAKRGMDGVAINEITEAADVGVGSFYNHF